MTFFVVVEKDRQPRSFRWCIRTGVNQPNVLGHSRAEKSSSDARRSAERIFGPLVWIEAAEAGVDERNLYVVQVARAELQHRLIDK